MQSIVRTLERTSKNLKAEKLQLQEELTQSRDQLVAKDKELREMKDSLRVSQEEATKLSDKCVRLPYLPPPHCSMTSIEETLDHVAMFSLSTLQCVWAGTFSLMLNLYTYTLYLGYLSCVPARQK